MRKREVSEIRRVGAVTLATSAVTRTPLTLLSIVLTIMCAPPVQAQSFSVIWNFGFAESPEEAGLIVDAAGNFYGITTDGGVHGYGTVYELPATGGQKTLYSFSGGTDGAQPRETNLIRDVAGNLYGVTPAGGIQAASCVNLRCGVVFGLTSKGQERTLYSFTGGSDGSTPVSPLTPGAEGGFYGTAATGGSFSGSCTPYGCGVVFSLSKSGRETVLHTFTGAPDGQSPIGNLLRDAAGNLYGTTSVGGNVSGSCPFPSGCGVVFKLDSSGNEAVLYSFTGGPDGAAPIALTSDGEGNLYGDTSAGGDPTSCPAGCGVVFEIDSEGNETTLYTFIGGTDGANPAGGLLLAPGALYGVTYDTTAKGCEPLGCGTVFKLMLSGNKTLVHSFVHSDGQSPEGSLCMYKGYLYGTTMAGGRNGGGVAYKLLP